MAASLPTAGHSLYICKIFAKNDIYIYIFGLLKHYVGSRPTYCTAQNETIIELKIT